MHICDVHMKLKLNYAYMKQINITIKFPYELDLILKLLKNETKYAYMSNQFPFHMKFNVI